jgi:hypothetical protein
MGLMGQQVASEPKGGLLTEKESCSGLRCPKSSVQRGTHSVVMFRFLWSAAHSRRITQARVSSRAVDSPQVHG